MQIDFVELGFVIAGYISDYLLFFRACQRQRQVLGKKMSEKLLLHWLW